MIRGSSNMLRRWLHTLPQRTFDNQSIVPRLPIPSLEETASTYLKSLRPLLSGKEYEASEKAVNEFISEGGQGPVLQQRLIDYDKKQKNSWLEDIWLKKAYLEWRESILINVNWWVAFRDSPKVEEELENTPPKGEYTPLQLQRATGLIQNLLDFKQVLDSEALAPEYLGKRRIPLCMNQYRLQFGVTRVPAPGCDLIHQTFPAKARHIVVLAEDQIYAVDVLNENGSRVTLEALQAQLENVVRKVKAQSVKQPAVGLLTSEHRDVWTKAREELLKLDPKNESSFKTIETALFAVCLEDYSTPTDLDSSHRVWFHGHNARNRWFDKSLSFIFMNNGRSGCSGEHSPSDAIIPAHMITEALKEPVKESPNAASSGLSEPRLLEWTVNKSIEDSIVKAEERAVKEIEDVDSVLLHFSDYGGDDIKLHAKVSPDAYVQMVFQLAYYRIYKKPCPTYESASTRQFLHGRTETIRSCSQTSVAFTKAFDNPDVPVTTKLEKMGEAIKDHIQYSILASTGKGVDRHLLGLRCMLQSGEKPPSIFTDPSYLKSMNFKLSSSNVSPGYYLYGGFGPVVPDGYGVNYAIGKDNLKFSISSRRHSQETCSKSFRKILKESLVDMMATIKEVRNSQD